MNVVQLYGGRDKFEFVDIIDKEEMITYAYISRLSYAFYPFRRFENSYGRNDFKKY